MFSYDRITTNAGYDFLLKFLLVGDAGVGKSCIVLRFADETYFTESYISTIGVDFKIRTIDIDGKKVKIQLWDTTGQERFRTITSSYYRGAQGVVLVYDTTCAASFSSLGHWVQEVDRYSSSSCLKIVVGNKSDLVDKCQVKEKDAKKWCETRGIVHYCVSAKSGLNIQSSFSSLAKMCMQRLGSSGTSRNAAIGFRRPGTQPGAATDVSSDEESFSDEDLFCDVATAASASAHPQLLGKQAQSSSASSSSSQQQKKKKKKKTHFKTDVNVCKLELQSLTTPATIATADPIKCSNCSAVLSCVSAAAVTRDPVALLRRRRAAAEKVKAAAAAAVAATAEGAAAATETLPQSKGLRGFFSSLFRSGSSSAHTADEKIEKVEKGIEEKEQKEDTRLCEKQHAQEQEGEEAKKDQENEQENEQEQDQNQDQNQDQDQDQVKAEQKDTPEAEAEVDAADGDDDEYDEDGGARRGGAGKDEKEEKEEKEEEESRPLVWVCDFCDEFVEVEEEWVFDELPSANAVDYLLEPAPPAAASASDAESSSSSQAVIFVVDISGSMCVTESVAGQVHLKGNRSRERQRELESLGMSETELSALGRQYLPTQHRNVTYVSRLQCVQAAVSSQIERIAKEAPSTRVGLVCFSDEVTLVGDGTQDPVVIAGDKLSDWQQLERMGQAASVPQPCSSSKDNLVSKVWQLQEGGQTALGPALHLGVSMAANAAGVGGCGQVVLCTDGRANLGLGSLDGKASDDSSSSPFYTEVAEKAKMKGVSVNVVTLQDTDCCVETLASVTTATSGNVTRVEAQKLTSEFGSILENRILGTGCFALILLHRGLQFRGELEDEADPTRNWLVKDIGNVTASTEASFSYGCRPKDVCDMTGLERVPFQVQVTYNKPDGSKFMRVVTEQITLTDKKERAEQSADVKMIGTYAAQRAARYAALGNYEQAQMETRAANRFLQRCGGAKLRSEEMNEWQKNVNQMDKVLQEARKQEADHAGGTPSWREVDGIGAESRAKMRKAKRVAMDQVAVTIHQQQAKSTSSFWGFASKK